MSDDRLFDSFRVLDRAIDPDPAFADRLFTSLAIDLGFRPTSRREAIERRLAIPRPVLRLGYVVALIGLLLGGAIAAALVGGQLLSGKTAADIVTASQEAELDPPAYDMTVQLDRGGVLRIRADGHGAWRVDRVEDRELPAGTYEVHLDGRIGTYDPAFRTWTVAADDLHVPRAFPMTWERPTSAGETLQPGTARPPAWFACADWRRLADDMIAGRPAYHVACDSSEFWVDQESSLLVAVQSPVGEALAGTPGRATALALRPAFPEGTFSLTAPAGAVTVDPGNRPASTVLAVGQQAPRWTGTTLDGTTVDTATMTGPLVAYFWMAWCEPCAGPHLTDLQAVAARHDPDVTTLTVAPDSLGTLVGYVDANHVELPVIRDPGTIAKAWGIEAMPVLVMLGRDGVVAALHLGPVSAVDLESMYAALASGRPVPAPGPTPPPPAEPLPSHEPGTPEGVSGLAVGDPAPSWSGPLLGGGTLDGWTLVGRPTVIWFGLGECSQCPTDPLEAFEAAHRRVGASANFVIVANGEPAPGSTAALFDRLGITVPLVFDWDGRIASAFELNILPTIVLDAGGRVADVAPGTLTTDEILERLQEVGAASDPSGPG